MTTSRRRNALIALAGVFVLAACSPSSGSSRPTETIGPIGVAPNQPAAGAVAPRSRPTISPIVSVPVLAPTAVVARNDNGDGFSVTETVPHVADSSIGITDPRIFFVGDSVSLRMASGNPDPMDAYVQALGWQVTLDGRVSRFTDEGIRVLKKRSSEIHQVLVLMLGNNYSGNQDEFRLQVAEILQIASAARRIIMFTVPLYDPKQMEVNQVLIDAAKTDPRLTVIDWETASRVFRGTLIGDGVHPTDYGSMILDQMLAVTLGVAPGGPLDAVLPTVGDHYLPGTPGWVDTNKGEGSPSIGDPNATIPPYVPPKPTTYVPPKATHPPTTSPSGSSSDTTSPTSGTTTTGPSATSGGTTTTPRSSTSTTTTTTGAATTTKPASTTTTTKPPATTATTPPASHGKPPPPTT
jgi:hypothetical protein